MKEAGDKHSELLRRLNTHISIMAPHQKDRKQGMLLIEARNAIQELLKKTSKDENTFIPVS